MGMGPLPLNLGVGEDAFMDWSEKKDKPPGRTHGQGEEPGNRHDQNER